MSTNPTAGTSQATQPPSPTPQKTPARLVVLLALLVIAIGALAFDYGVAGPGVEAADEKIHKHVDESNRQSVKDGKSVTPDEVQKLLGKRPTWVEKHADEQYEVEYYCWRGPLPVLNMQKHYLAIVYLGDEPRRYSSHYKNERPPIEALPIQQGTPEVTDETVPPPTSPGESKGGDAKGDAKGDEAGSTEAKTGDPPPAEPEGDAKPEGGKKRKGKKQAD